MNFCMKKYLFPFLAIVLGIAFSAFTPQKKASEKTLNSEWGPLYWFDAHSCIYTGSHNSKFIEENFGCDDSGSDFCEFGYDDFDLLIPAHPEYGLNIFAVPDDVIRVTFY
jgi:hypothetical protein